MKSEGTKIGARILPRDKIDVLVGLPIGVLQSIAIFGLPSLVAFLIGYALGWGFVISFIGASITFLVTYCAWLAFTVWSLRLSENGIHFVRLFGYPKFLRWNELTEVVEVTRREVIVRGWLWPLFPTREMTPTLSGLRHFRIRWGERYCYYPPNDAQAFVKLIDDFRTKQSN